MKNERNHARHHVGLTLALVGLMCGVTLMPGSARLASAQSFAPSWTYTGNLNFARVNHTATLLPNGKVLVAGGFWNGVLNSAEVYDPATGTWSSTGNLNTAREGHTATLLPNGKVLVAGANNTDSGANNRGLNSAELYDPATGTWTSTGSLNAARRNHTATLLPNGKVLAAGGDTLLGHSTELYDPATGTWSITGNLNTVRAYHTATLLLNGKVLVAGGFLAGNTAELYDPATGTWSVTGNLDYSSSGRTDHTATLLPNGKVLLAGGILYFCGGELCDDVPTNDAELYDPATGTWSATSNLNIGNQTATLLPDGKVLGVGEGAELYDPATGTWNYTANPNTSRYYHTATLLPNGKVLVAGGDTFFGHSTELYDPGALNQIDDAQIFVRQHYIDFLNREPDAGGLAYWTNRITECGSDARCIHERRIGVSAAFFIEQEFQDTGYYVYRFYKASFGRQPNYTEFTADRANLIGGPNLEANKQAFADQWVQRTAFTQTFPNTLSNTEFVNKLFDTAGLTASTYNPQRQQEIDVMNVGRSRALILRDVIEI